MSDDFFAPPPFKPAEALQGLKRQLRELGLAERSAGAAFEWRGRAVVELSQAGNGLVARLVKRPAHTPEWTAQPLASGADVRRFVEQLRRQLAQWDDSRD